MLELICMLMLFAYIVGAVDKAQINCCRISFKKLWMGKWSFHQTTFAVNVYGCCMNGGVPLICILVSSIRSGQPLVGQGLWAP